MVTRKTWGEFRKAGLLLIINQFLHIFGWAIVVEVDDNTGEVTECYPARVKFRGFDQKIASEAYKRVTNHLKENIDELVEEASS
jgi:hypothetical protein